MSALEHFRREKDEFFRTSPQSPLTSAQKRSFQGLCHFPENPGLDLTLDLELLHDPSPLSMQTTAGDVQIYERYGRIRFEVEGQAASLIIYRSESGLFLPFVDALAGKETYGGGRYLEPEELAGNRVRVDFNLAYNPYCAYNDRWSCPITPAENRLKVAIRAGEKVFEHHP